MNYKDNENPVICCADICELLQEPDPDFSAP
jgi:hypothetical protein